MSSRTVTVTLTADTTAFTQLMRAGAVSMAEALVNAKELARIFTEAMGGVQEILERDGAALRRGLDRFDMQLQGDQQKAIALGWWDHHLDDVYASLNLPRDPNLIRGDN